MTLIRFDVLWTHGSDIAQLDFEVTSVAMKSLTDEMMIAILCHYSFVSCKIVFVQLLQYLVLTYLVFFISRYQIVALYATKTLSSPK